MRTFVKVVMLASKIQWTIPMVDCLFTKAVDEALDSALGFTRIFDWSTFKPASSTVGLGCSA